MVAIVLASWAEGWSVGDRHAVPATHQSTSGLGH